MGGPAGEGTGVLHSIPSKNAMGWPCTAHRGRAQGPEAQARLGLCSGMKELERTARAGNPEAPHSTSKAVLLPPGRQPHSPKELKKLSSLSSAKKSTTECYCICTAQAIIELSIPQGDCSRESDTEISDIIFQRT